MSTTVAVSEALSTSEMFSRGLHQVMKHHPLVGRMLIDKINSLPPSHSTQVPLKLTDDPQVAKPCDRRSAFSETSATGDSGCIGCGSDNSSEARGYSASQPEKECSTPPTARGAPTMHPPAAAEAVRASAGDAGRVPAERDRSHPLGCHEQDVECHEPPEHLRGLEKPPAPCHDRCETLLGLEG